jgi:hypothetical protein
MLPGFPSEASSMRNVATVRTKEMGWNKVTTTERVSMDGQLTDIDRWQAINSLTREIEKSRE